MATKKDLAKIRLRREGDKISQLIAFLDLAGINIGFDDPEEYEVGMDLSTLTMLLEKAKNQEVINKDQLKLIIENTIANSPDAFEAAHNIIHDLSNRLLIASLYRVRALNNASKKGEING